jgi:hypothetical protein
MGTLTTPGLGVKRGISVRVARGFGVSRPPRLPSLSKRIRTVDLWFRSWELRCRLKFSQSFARVLARKIHDFRNTEGLAMVQIRYPGGFETKSEAFT